MPAFVRSSPEIDKAALIAQRDDPTLITVMPFCGLKVTNDECFFVETDLTPVEKRET
jgi:hypothetical protein